GPELPAGPAAELHRRVRRRQRRAGQGGQQDAGVRRAGDDDRRHPGGAPHRHLQRRRHAPGGLVPAAAGRPDHLGGCQLRTSAGVVALIGALFALLMTVSELSLLDRPYRDVLTVVLIAGMFVAALAQLALYVLGGVGLLARKRFGPPAAIA